uniref:Uncharacterized protein n=1 Tax=Lepeophtheirus salmonis TaxID=72036 RepID=A0A0K2TDI2_LEPSM
MKEGGEGTFHSPTQGGLFIGMCNNDSLFTPMNHSLTTIIVKEHQLQLIKPYLEQR